MEGEGGEFWTRRQLPCWTPQHVSDVGVYWLMKRRWCSALWEVDEEWGLVSIYNNLTSLDGVLEVLDGGSYSEELPVKCTVVELSVVQLPAEEGEGL